MTISHLVPHISCVCGAGDLNEALAQGFKEIYIITTKGTFKHHQLRGEGRFIRMKVDSIPGYSEPAVTESMNFFPAGKIPYTIFEQIQAFFMEVMRMNSSEVEAMVHVLWNEEKGYHLGVPPQTISKASVRYDWSYIPSGTSIIVDVHSHNTMGAFFSGTDDGDDRNNVSFSGVFGKLKDPVPQTVWRFNYFAKKFEASVSDIFEASPGVTLDPALASMMENVKVQHYPVYSSPYQGGGHSNLGNVGSSHAGRGGPPNGRTYDHLKPYQFPKKGQVNSPAPENQAKINPTQDDLERAYEEYYGGGITSHAFDFGSEEFTNSHISRPGAVWRADTPAQNGDKKVISISDSKALTSREERIADEILKANLQSESNGSYTDEELDQMNQDMKSIVGKRVGVDQIQDPVGAPEGFDGRDEDPMYEIIAGEHGGDVADAWWGINNDMAFLDGKDELLESLCSDMVNLMSEDGQVKMFKKVFDSLPSRQKEKIQTFGM